MRRYLNTLTAIGGLALSFLAAPSSALAVEPAEYAAFNRALTDELIVPAYENFAIQTALLAEAMTPFCTAPDDEGLLLVRRRFHDAMDAWQYVQPIAFGPVWTHGGPARIQFWPDKRGTGQRQLRRAIAGEDSDLLSPGALAARSVALGDFQALEQLLFAEDEALAAPGSFACRFALAIAENQRSISATHLRNWTRTGGFRDHVVTAAGGNDSYFDASEASVDMLRSIVGTLENIRLLKLERPMGESADEARGNRAENWRSARSLRNIELNLRMARALIAADGGFGDLLTAHGGEVMGEDMVAHLSAAIDLAEDFERPLSELVADEEERPGLEKLMALILLVREIMTDHAAPQVELVTGFNASDGD